MTSHRMTRKALFLAGLGFIVLRSMAAMDWGKMDQYKGKVVGKLRSDI